MILIVLPILCLLMFELGLTLKMDDFGQLARQPRAVAAGMLGQIVLLPVIAIVVAETLHLPPLFYVGLVLIACCPGGSSSNVFSMLARGDVALSVTLTALSSVITLFTLPLIMAWAVTHCGGGVQGNIELPVGNLLVQNIVLMFLPMALGALMKWKWSKAANATDKVLRRLAFPALMLLAGIFFVQHHDTIAGNFAVLGGSVLALLLLAVACAALMSQALRLKGKQRRTIVIEVGMQNAAQAITVASSPFIFNNSEIAIPAIIYALLMNVVLLTYVGVYKLRTENND